MRTKKTGAVAGLVLATLAAALTPSAASATIALPSGGGVTKVATAAPVVLRQVRLNVPRSAEVGSGPTSACSSSVAISLLQQVPSRSEADYESQSLSMRMYHCGFHE